MPMSQRSGQTLDRPPLQDRLIQEVEKRKENREKLKRNKDLEELKECSFHPKITDYKVVPKNPKMGHPQYHVRSQTPIHERIGEIQREKIDNLQRLKVRSEQEQKDLTF